MGHRSNQFFSYRCKLSEAEIILQIRKQRFKQWYMGTELNWRRSFRAPIRDINPECSAGTRPGQHDESVTNRLVKLRNHTFRQKATVELNLPQQLRYCNYNNYF